MDGRFQDRRDAGRRLATELGAFKDIGTVVLALPRGGVPVAYEVATRLDLPLSLYFVQKVGVPGHRELAMGAIASGGCRVLNEDLIVQLRIPRAVVDAAVAEEERELARREQQYATGRCVPLAGRPVILVDDGLATGATMRAAVKAVRQQQPSHVVAAVPVGSPSACDDLRHRVDDFVCLRTPKPFTAIGLLYCRFEQTSDDDVRELLDAAEQRAWHEIEKTGTAARVERV